MSNINYGYNYFKDNVKILSESVSDDESGTILPILENTDSPINRKYQEKLFKSVINKAHIDFEDIPKSMGNIRQYSGYPSMVETLKVLEGLATEDKAGNVLSYVKIVQEAIKNMEDLSATYQKGFTSKTDYVALEYDCYVYFCVEATTALIYSFVEIMKMPDKMTHDMKLKNTKLRADEFYFEQLKKFNRVQYAMGINYRKMLEQMCEKGRQNFLGELVSGGVGTSELVGLTAIIGVILAIVPLTREVIYQIYNFRGKVSTNLEVQAKFLELNRACLENKTELTVEKRQKIMKKQENLAKDLRKLSGMIRVKSAKSIADSKRELDKDNKMLSINNIKEEISSGPLEFI